jgi:hypothetical protein
VAVKEPVELITTGCFKDFKTILGVAEALRTIAELVDNNTGEFIYV